MNLSNNILREFLISYRIKCLVFCFSLLVFTNVVTPLWSANLHLLSIAEKAEDRNETTWISKDNTIRIPLKRAGRLLYLEAIVDGVSGNLILDTGAPGLVLNKSYFRDYEPVYQTETGGITGSTGMLYRKWIDSLYLGAITFHTLKTSLVDLGHIENKRGLKVIGLLGVDVLKDFAFLINLKANYIDLYVLNSDGEPLAELPFKLANTKTIPVNYYHDLICLKLEIGGKKMSVCFDTAAEMSFLDSRLPKRAMKQIRIERKVNLVGAGAHQKEVLLGKVNRVQFNEFEIIDFPVLLGSFGAMNEAYGSHLKGMLGFDFMEQGELLINLKKKQLWIIPFKR